MTESKMTPEEKAAKRAEINAEIKRIEAEIADLKDRLNNPPPKQDTQGSEVGSQEPITNTAELEENLRDAEAELLALRTKYNTYAGRRTRSKVRKTRRRHRTRRHKATRA